jgi:hypothetical protein
MSEAISIKGRLDAFVGQWKKEGRAHDGPFGPAAQIQAMETFEWLPGGAFLIHRLEGRVGDQKIACIEIIGHEPSHDDCAAHTFYSDGRHTVWRVRERDGVWTWTTAGPLQVRCTSVFGNGGNAMTGTWEYSSDGSIWHVFWDTTLLKVPR